MAKIAIHLIDRVQNILIVVNLKSMEGCGVKTATIDTE